MDDLIEALLDVLGDFWFVLFSPTGLLVSLVVLVGGLEITHYLMYGGWVG